VNYTNYTQSYTRPVAKIGIRQHLLPRDLFKLSGWTVLWRPLGKLLLMIFPLVLVINMCVASAITSIDHSLVNVDNERHELMDKNIALLARKAKLWAPASIQRMAGEKLALYANSGDQVTRFDSRSKTFGHP